MNIYMMNKLRPGDRVRLVNHLVHKSINLPTGALHVTQQGMRNREVLVVSKVYVNSHIEVEITGVKESFFLIPSEIELIK